MSRDENIGDGFDHFCHQHSKDVTNFQSPTSHSKFDYQTDITVTGFGKMLTDTVDICQLDTKIGDNDVSLIVMLMTESW